MSFVIDLGKKMKKGFESILLWALGISALALVGMFVAVFIIYFSGPSATSQHLQYFGQVGDLNVTQYAFLTL